MHLLSIGYARVDLTPAGSVALCGYGDDSRRLSVGVLDPITGTCIAISDKNNETVLIYSLDLLAGFGPLTAAAREAVTQATGIPANRIMLAGTHTHAGPSVGTMHLDSTKRFFDQTIQLLVQAAQNALADRAPATITAGRCETNKMSFVRHYKMENGTYGGDNFGIWDSPIIAHASPADEQIQLARFIRKGRQDNLLVNWQAHAKMSSTATTDFGRAYRKHISSDYIGYAREELERQTGMQVIYFTGAAGNLNPSSRIESEPTSEDPAVYGRQLAQAALAGLGQMQPIDSGNVSSRQQMVTIPVDHSDDHLVELAEKIWAIWPQDQQLCKDTARANGFNSAYAARDVISRSQAGVDRTMELDTVGVGDLAFAIASYEMFCVNGQHIKENSPYAMTFILTCANGYDNYLPSDFAFTHGGYEVDSRRFARGSAEQMADHFLQMLRKQKNEK